MVLHEETAANPEGQPLFLLERPSVFTGNDHISPHHFSPLRASVLGI